MSGLFSSEGDNPPPFMQDNKKPEPEKAETPVEPVPETKPVENVVEKSTAEAEAAVERSTAATEAPTERVSVKAQGTYSAAEIAKHATFEDIMKAGQIRAKDDKVQMILNKAKDAYDQLVAKVGEDVAKRAIGQLYMEAIEGRLIAADAAQRNPV